MDSPWSKESPDFRNNKSLAAICWQVSLTYFIYLEERQTELPASCTVPSLFRSSEWISARKFFIPSLPCCHSTNRLWSALTNQNYTKRTLICLHTNPAKLHNLETSFTWDWPKWELGSGKLSVRGGYLLYLVDPTFCFSQRLCLLSLSTVVWIQVFSSSLSLVLT